MRLGQTVEIMAAGFGIRTGRHHITGCEKLTRQSARLFHDSAQSGGAFSFKGASRGVLASMVVPKVKAVVLRLRANRSR
jgi:hypothetical protein